MKDLLKRLKGEQKAHAELIRAEKAKRSAENSGYVAGLHELRLYFRYRHVVYCLLRGRALEQIETKPRIPLDQPRLEKTWVSLVGMDFPNRPAWPEKKEVANEEALRASAP